MKTEHIVDQLEIRIGIGGAPMGLTTAIERTLIESFGLLPIRAVERAEKVTVVVARIIAERASKSDEAGVVSTLTLLGISHDQVAGCCYVLPTDDSSVAHAKRNRQQAGQLLTAIRALTFSEFEKFGAKVLLELGAKSSRITPHANDQGIDFFGHLSLGQFQPLQAPFVKLAHDVVLLLAGQAKHYQNSSIGPNVVRELVGAIELARTETFSKQSIDVFDELRLKPFAPLVMLLFTTGGLTAGARQLAEEAGIIARSGEQLAVFLADRGVGMKPDSSGSIFDMAKFMSWLG